MVTRKPIIEVIFNDFIDWEWWICIFNKIGFNAFYVIMKRILINDLSIRHSIKLILYENDVKLLKFKRIPVWEFNLWYVWSLKFWLLIPEMNASRKAIEWLICFSIVNLILGCLLFKKLKKSVNLAHCQKQLECHQHILIKFRFVKIIFIKPFRFVKAPEDVSEDRS